MSHSTPQRRRWLWLPLLGIAAWLAFFGDKTPTGQMASNDASLARPITTSVVTTPRSSEPAISKSTKLDALLPRGQLFPLNARKTAVNDLFSANSWTPPPPPPPPPPPKPVVAAPLLPLPPPPTAPSIPFTYIGKKFEGNTWEVYVTRGEQSFVLREGSTVDNNYRVQRILPPSLSLIYLPLGQTQTLSIGESQ